MNKTGGSLSGPEYLRAGLLSFLISRIVSPRLDSEFLEPIANAWTRRPAMSALARSDV